MSELDRRRFLTLLAAGGAAALSGCDRLAASPGMRSLLAVADAPTDAALDALTPDTALAQEFTEADLSPVFGYGAGARYRSPVGPVNLDLAYGEATGEFRLHFSLGVSF